MLVHQLHSVIRMDSEQVVTYAKVSDQLGIEATDPYRVRHPTLDETVPL